MRKNIIAEGKTTNEAISNGLKELNVSKDKVEIKVLENEEKRSFFSILSPRIVKVELTLKDDMGDCNERLQKNIDRKVKINKAEEDRPKREFSKEDIELSKKNIEEFLINFAKNFGDMSYDIKTEEEFVVVEIKGDDSSKLIGYRGETLNALQTIINSIANKNCETKIKVILNIGDYKQRREKALEELADKVSKTVLKTGKSITLEPMTAYERKIIHSRLEDNNLVRTYSIGDEPYRKVVIAKNN